MSEFDALLFVLSLAVLPIGAIAIAHYVLWDLDRSLAKPKAQEARARARR